MSELRFHAPDAELSVDVPEGIINPETGEVMLLADVEVVDQGSEAGMSNNGSEIQTMGGWSASKYDVLGLAGAGLIALSVGLYKGLKEIKKEQRK